MVAFLWLKCQMDVGGVPVIRKFKPTDAQSHPAPIIAAASWPRVDTSGIISRCVTWSRHDATPDLAPPSARPTPWAIDVKPTRHCARNCAPRRFHCSGRGSASRCQYWCQLAIENDRNRSKLVETSRHDKSSTIKETRVNRAFPHRPGCDFESVGRVFESPRARSYSSNRSDL
jgi:hypothetical protein